MIRNLKCLIFIFASLLLISCDPIHEINFINTTDSDVKVKINVNPKIENYDLREISRENPIIFNIKQKDTTNIYFGIGTWSDNQINELVNSINSLEIETKDAKNLYKSKKSITKLLKENRKGFLETSIEIEIE